MVCEARFRQIDVGWRWLGGGMEVWGGAICATERKSNWRRHSDSGVERKGVEKEGGGLTFHGDFWQRARSALLPTRMMGTWSA